MRAVIIDADDRALTMAREALAEVSALEHFAEFGRDSAAHWVGRLEVVVGQLVGMVDARLKVGSRQSCPIVALSPDAEEVLAPRVEVAS